MEESIFGLGMVEEPARHGYRISPGALYPLPHGHEKKGYLKSKQIRGGKSRRKAYRATPLGRKALIAAKGKLRELMEGKSRSRGTGGRTEAEWQSELRP